MCSHENGKLFGVICWASSLTWAHLAETRTVSPSHTVLSCTRADLLESNTQHIHQDSHIRAYIPRAPEREKDRNSVDVRVCFALTFKPNYISKIRTRTLKYAYNRWGFKIYELLDPPRHTYVPKRNERKKNANKLMYIEQIAPKAHGTRTQYHIV